MKKGWKGDSFASIGGHPVTRTAIQPVFIKICEPIPPEDKLEKQESGPYGIWQKNKVYMY